MTSSDRNRCLTVSMEYLPIWEEKEINLLGIRDVSEQQTRTTWVQAEGKHRVLMHKKWNKIFHSRLVGVNWFIYFCGCYKQKNTSNFLATLKYLNTYIYIYSTLSSFSTRIFSYRQCDFLIKASMACHFVGLRKLQRVPNLQV